MRTTADFVYPEVLSEYMNKDSKDYVKKIARWYWFIDVNFIKSELMPTEKDNRISEHPFNSFK